MELTERVCHRLKAHFRKASVKCIRELIRRKKVARYVGIRYMHESENLNNEQSFQKSGTADKLRLFREMEIFAFIWGNQKEAAGWEWFLTSGRRLR